MSTRRPAASGRTPVDEALARVLRLVAEGRLTADEAEPIVAQLTGNARSDAGEGATAVRDSGRGQHVRRDREEHFRGPAGRRLRLEILDHGRKSVEMNLPFSLAAIASVIPGLSEAQAEQLRASIRAGATGALLRVVDEDGDGVVLVAE